MTIFCYNKCEVFQPVKTAFLHIQDCNLVVQQTVVIWFGNTEQSYWPESLCVSKLFRNCASTEKKKYVLWKQKC